MRRFRLALFATLLALATADSLHAEDLGAKAVQIFEKHCYTCHGQNGSAEGGMSYIVDPVKLVTGKKVVPGDADNSRIYLRLTSPDDPMPPEGEEPRPTEADIATIKRWIDAGAPPPQSNVVEPRPFVSLRDQLTAVDEHLASLHREDRPYQRYFSLTHLHNMTSVREVDFRLYRAALSKVINSLSWKPDIVLPQAVDQCKTLFAVDLRDLDWDRSSLWQHILEVYPYGLKHDHYPRDTQTNELARQIYETTGTEVPIIRADWFIATAARPPLYYKLLQIPDTSRQLEQALRVDVEANFRRNRLWRAGFAKSGVSAQNRLVERHSALYGAYWISYDFKPANALGNLFRYPLGPKFVSNPYNRQAFEQDGGEIIFHLPNGLQGYMLIGAEGKRIDTGPTDVVRDTKEVSGSTAIVAGVSCMSCHAHGMISDFEDAVRLGTAVQGESHRKVRSLYSEPEVMNRLVAKDRTRFLEALEAAIGPFVRAGESDTKDITAYPEPIGKIAKWYQLQDLGVEEITAELGMKDPTTLQTAIKFNSHLRAMGLGPLEQGHTIKREWWQEFRGMSTYQSVSSELGLGTPLVYPRQGR